MGRKGYKSCRECGTEVGCRTKVCKACGFVFLKLTEKTPKRIPKKREEYVYDPVNTEKVCSQPPVFKRKATSAPPSLPPQSGPRKKKAEKKTRQGSKHARCSWHPHYLGEGKPVPDCCQCWSIFLKRTYGLEMITRTEERKIRITDAGLLRQLISNLKECLKNAEHAGGAHSAFIPHHGGQVQIEIQTK